MAQDQNIIQNAIDKDVASGKLIPVTNSTTDRRNDVINSGTYDIYIEIDCDCEELLDACGLDYRQCEDDKTQNEICLTLNKDEFMNEFDGIDVIYSNNEQTIGERLLNTELGEYVTKVTIYKPTGDIISFC